MSIAHEHAPSMLDAALGYAARGWAVFPCHSLVRVVAETTYYRCYCGKRCSSPGKHPCTRDGLKSASTDTNQIREWWRKSPNANIGIATGAVSGGLVVIDLDVKHDGVENWRDLAERSGGHPDCPTALTGGGGRHLFFHSTDALQNSVSVIAPGVDVRAEGGYVIAAPSLHASGASYAWELSSDPADVAVPALPAWVLALAGRKRTPGKRAAGAPATFPEGGRNDGLYKLACSLRAKGLEHNEILPALLAANTERCVPPLDDVEVAKIVASACTHEPGGSAPTSPSPPDDGREWTKQLACSGKWNLPKPTHGNACVLLRNEPTYAGRLRFDESRQSVVLDGALLTDGDIGRIREDLEHRWFVAFSADTLHGAALTVAQEQTFHPLRDYLRGLRWDGERRIARVLTEVLRAKDDDLSQLFIGRWFLSAVARALRPGCKCDTALVLVGKQGARKSTFFAMLGGDWFSDDAIDLSNKDAFLQIARAWIIEWGEIEHVTSRRHAGEIKGFLSKRIDQYRAPYGRTMIEVPRGCVFVGSTNQSRFLEDETGSRRFWVVEVGEIDATLLAAWRDQLWAEAVQLLDSGERWWLEASEDSARELRADNHRVSDPWESVLRVWLQRQPRTDHTSAEIFANCLNVPLDRQGKTLEMRLGDLLHRLGCERRKMRLQRDGKKTSPTWAWVFNPKLDGSEE